MKYRDCITRELTADVKDNSISRIGLVSRLAAAVLSENSILQISPTAAVESEDATSTERHPERSSVFELLDSAIIEVLAPNIRLAANVISHLYKLPANLRSLVYGFITHGNEGGGYYNAPPPAEHDSESQQPLSISRPSTKKRKGDQDGDEDPEDQRPKDTRSRSRVYSKTKIIKLKYACHFNIKDPERYCVRNEIGGTGDLYSSCMGTGWTELRGLL